MAAMLFLPVVILPPSTRDMMKNLSEIAPDKIASHHFHTFDWSTNLNLRELPDRFHSTIADIDPRGTEAIRKEGISGWLIDDAPSHAAAKIGGIHGTITLEVWRERCKELYHGFLSRCTRSPLPLAAGS